VRRCSCAAQNKCTDAGSFDNLVPWQVVKTEKSGHAHSIMKHASKEELNALDGVIVVVCTLSNF
jgi:hypothetical protein